MFSMMFSPWELHQEGGRHDREGLQVNGMGGGGGSTLIGTLSQIFSIFYFDASPYKGFWRHFFAKNVVIKINTHLNYCTTCLFSNHYNDYNKNITFSITQNPLVSTSQIQTSIFFYHFFHLFHISELNIISSCSKGWKLNFPSFLIPKKIETNLARNQNFPNCTIKPFWN